ncbi:hypothetical protein [Luteibacter sp.]|nr:hypothetical protein [Luteibacter sp.]MDQ8048091.1 hypothetical protein [Luteibacter sp.]
MKRFLMLPLALTLAGCATTDGTHTDTEYTAVNFDASGHHTNYAGFQH